MGEFAGDVQEGLLAMAVGTGLQVMAALMNADVRRWPGRRASTIRAGVRCGTAPSAGRSPSAGRRVPVTRPRVRAADGTGSCRCGV